MTVILNFERNKIVNPNRNICDNTLPSKNESNNINNNINNAIKDERIETLQINNENLHKEIQDLKKELTTLDHKTLEKNDNNDLMNQLKSLAYAYKSEVKKCSSLSIKVEKLEQLIQDVYACEEDNKREIKGIDSIVSINHQLSTFLKKLKD